MRPSDGRLALGCARWCWVRLTHCAPRFFAPDRLRRPFFIDGGPDLFRQMVGGRFCALVWQRRVVQRQFQVRATVFWFKDSRIPGVVRSMSSSGVVRVADPGFL